MARVLQKFSSALPPLHICFFAEVRPSCPSGTGIGCAGGEWGLGFALSCVTRLPTHKHMFACSLSLSMPTHTYTHTHIHTRSYQVYTRKRMHIIEHRFRFRQQTHMKPEVAWFSLITSLSAAFAFTRMDGHADDTGHPYRVRMHMNSRPCRWLCVCGFGPPNQ